MEMDNTRNDKGLVRGLMIIMSIFIVFGAVFYFIQTHFLWNTTIEGIDCSFLSIEKATEKINLEMGEREVTFSFTSGKTYDVALKQLGIRVDENRITQLFKQQHFNPREAREYELDGFILADEEMLRNVLKQIPELQEENMVEPQNAYIIWDEETVQFSIQKETSGSVIIFEKAMDFTLEKIKNDEKQIDFNPIYEKAEILTEDLVNERDELNIYLNSTINFELSDGSIVTLDSNIIKNWVYQDENGKFLFDTENGVPAFVEELAVKVNDANSYMYFIPSESNEVARVNVPREVRAQLDKEKQIAEIKLILGYPEPLYKKPVYDRTIINDIILSSRIEIDITRQHIWFYLDETLILHTDCVTGNVRYGYDTPTGVYFLLNKDPGALLEGYNIDGSMYSVTVKYWMRFVPGIGMHDAYWREVFGGDIYLTNGSHGCVNMPEWAAALMYEYINNTIPIIVYQS